MQSDPRNLECAARAPASAALSTVPEIYKLSGVIESGLALRLPSRSKFVVSAPMQKAEPLPFIVNNPKYSGLLLSPTVNQPRHTHAKRAR